MYSMIAFVASAVKGHDGVSYAKRSGSAVDRTFGTFNSFGTIMFAFGGQIVMPEIQVPEALLTAEQFSTHGMVYAENKRQLSCKLCKTAFKL